MRVVCNYIDDIYRIAELLTAQADITLLPKTDYIAEPNPNGYRSLRLVVEVPVFLSVGRVPVPVEIQIRTLATDFWESLEHQNRYKSESDLPPDDASLHAELKQCADACAALEVRMQQLYRRICSERTEG